MKKNVLGAMKNIFDRPMRAIKFQENGGTAVKTGDKIGPFCGCFAGFLADPDSLNDPHLLNAHPRFFEPVRCRYHETSSYFPTTMTNIPALYHTQTSAFPTKIDATIDFALDLFLIIFNRPQIVTLFGMNQSAQFFWAKMASPVTTLPQTLLS